jgi:hypothetical protein
MFFHAAMDDVVRQQFVWRFGLFKDPRQVRVLGLHELVDKRNGRASAQSFYADSLNSIFSSLVFFIVGILDIINCKLPELPIFFTGDSEVSMATLAPVNLVAAAKDGLRHVAFTQPCAGSHHNSRRSLLGLH